MLDIIGHNVTFYHTGSFCRIHVTTWKDFINKHWAMLITSPPIGGGRGIVMPMSVCPCFRKISMCNISVISQPIIMKLDIHIEYGYSVTDKYFQNFRSKVKVIGHRNVFPRNSNM